MPSWFDILHPHRIICVCFVGGPWTTCCLKFVSDFFIVLYLESDRLEVFLPFLSVLPRPDVDLVMDAFPSLPLLLLRLPFLTICTALGISEPAREMVRSLMSITLSVWLRLLPLRRLRLLCCLWLVSSSSSIANYCNETILLLIGCVALLEVLVKILGGDACIFMFSWTMCTELCYRNVSMELY